MLSLIKVSSSEHFWEKTWQANLISAMSANRNREWKSLSVWDALLSIDAHNASKCTSICNRCSQPHTTSNSSICNRGFSSPPVITYLQARLPLPRSFFHAFRHIFWSFITRLLAIIQFHSPYQNRPSSSCSSFLINLQLRGGEEWWNKRWWYHDNAKYEWIYPRFQFHFLILFHGTVM